MPVPPEKRVPKSLNDYLEIMSKSVFQSGMSWKVIESKWSGIREALRAFDVRAVADLDEKGIEDLLKDTRLIRNRRKLTAIVGNAQKMLELDEEYGAFQQYLRAHGGFDATLAAIRKDFRFMGATGIYVFLYTVGEDVIPHEEFERQYRR